MSKLILAIIFHAEAVDPLSEALLAGNYSVTKISSMGGFLRRQNTTFVIGVEEARLQGAMQIIRDVCAPFSRPEGHAATIFVLDVAEFARA
ncbi:MAG TPA: cyclic-di-AMP receptor [Phototrophicaceae bacterium]|nr:cyclic-di-AMP receptor [Phototrophicaceae bacterium]